LHEIAPVVGLNAAGSRGTECKYYAEHPLQDTAPFLFTARVLRLFSLLWLPASLVLDFESRKRSGIHRMILPGLIKELQTLLAIGLVHFECDAVFFIFSLWAAA
jgi:hypothetical protein